jgi:hypothetical protein
MATTTPNFGWPVPTSTDLVKNGATAIEALGDAIDASMADLEGGTTGQILAKNSNTDMDFVWIANDQGDITGVTATSPITGGGTSGAITIGILSGTTSNLGAVQLSTSTSSTSTSLAATASAVKEAYDPAFTNNFYAGKNKVINGNFANWQRGTTLTYTSSGLNYLADRFFSWTIGTCNVTVSQQTFTPGTAPVAGYEGQYFMRNAVTSLSGQSIQAVGQRIEDVRTLAGQTATFSFWAKADASRTYTTRLIQNFGSGGSSEVAITGGSHSVTTSWQRFSVTVSIPSVSGKTIGTSSYLQPLLDGPSNTANILDTWGWQLEAGSAATPFQTATGTIQGELEACMRYYQKYSGTDGAFINGTYYTTTAFYGVFTFPVMRTAPTATIPATSLNVFSGAANRISTAASAAQILPSALEIQGTTSVAVAGAGGFVRFNTGGQIELSAEL